MSGRGRKRKDGPREANGRPQRESTADIMATAQIQRMKAGATDKNWRDDRLECPLGRLLLFGWLRPEKDEPWHQGDDHPNDGAELYRAGVSWRRQVGIARWLHDIPAPFERSANLLVSYGLQGERADVDPEVRAQLLRSYNDAFGALLDAGHTAIRAVNRLVIHERAVDPEDIPLVRRGLYALAVHYGEIGKRKKAS